MCVHRKERLSHRVAEGGSWTAVCFSFQHIEMCAQSHTYIIIQSLSSLAQFDLVSFLQGVDSRQLTGAGGGGAGH